MGWLESLILLLEASPAFLLFVTALFSLSVGSFLNVVIHRLPIMMERSWLDECAELMRSRQLADHLPAAEPVAASAPFNLAVPESRCPSCGHRIRWWENIPLLSYIGLLGRCSGCGTHISLRYPAVELLTALLSMVVVWKLGATLHALAVLSLTWALVALSFIDFDRQLLPDSIVLPFLWLGLLLSLLPLGPSPANSILGAAAGYLSLWSVFHLFRLATGKEGMGQGDFKLLALFGAWGGWVNLLQVVLLSSLVGALLGILLLLGGRERGRPMPFGPFLAIAGWISLLWGEQLNRAWFQLFIPS